MSDDDIEIVDELHVWAPGWEEKVADLFAHVRERRRLERGPWLHYTTHQVACPVGPWQTRSKEVMCTCGYTLLVDAALAAGAE